MLRPDQISHIAKLYRAYMRRGYTQQQACSEIGQLYDRSALTILKLIQRLFADTTEVAQQYFKANALRMAMTVVREGNVQQKMDILTRSNIGVLAPAKAQADSSRGFFLTVSADSCGAVKASVGVIEGVPHAAPGSEIPSEDDQLWQESQARLRGESGGGGQEPENGGDTHPRGVPAGSGEAESGLQVIDVEPEEPEVKRDSLGRRSWSLTPEGQAHLQRLKTVPKTIGRSPTYQAAVERAKKRLEDAKV